MVDFTALRSLLTGALHVPADSAFALATSGFNLAVVHAPDAVVVVADTADISHVVTFARDNRLKVSVQATGHGAESPISGGILINTSRLDSVSIDADGRLATVGAGVRWGAVVAAAADVKLAPITGSSPTVGVVGLITGGGLGPLARSHGFASDYARGFTVVTGTGDIVEATATENADLFWALRGGKVGLGIIAEARIALVELENLYAGSLIFSEEHIEAVAQGWARWTESANADLTTSISVVRFPGIEVVPPPLRGRTLLVMHVAYPGDAITGEGLAAPLRALAPPYLDSLGVLAARDVAQIHNDPTQPGPGWASGGLLASIDQKLIAAWLGVVGAGRDIPAVMSEIRHFGSATTVDVPEGSAASGRSAQGSLTFIGAPVPDLFTTVVPAAADALFAATARWLAPESNVNFAGITRPGQKGSLWSAATAERLTTIRRRYDPDGVFA
ncbi:MAG: FAD-binding oxidoreductase [Salinibacterium sp.]|nr:FAD-binding oxidoreductase [Salinibacterium sp.]